MRFSTFVFLAAALHVAIPLGARIAPNRQALLVAHSSSERMVEIDIENLPPPPPRPDDREPLIERPQDVAMNQPLDRERVRLPDTSDVYPENTPPPTNVEPIPISPDDDDDDRDGGPDPVVPAKDTIDAACAQKLGLLAGRALAGEAGPVD